MADGAQTFVENNEEQDFSMHESDQHHLVGSVEEFDHQNMVENYHNFGGDVSDNQGLEVNGQGFGTDEPENNYGVLSDQVFADNQNHHTLEGDEGINGLDENEPKVEFTNNEADETGNPTDKKDETQNNTAGVGNEKKWPGWPGESVFRILVPTQKVGNIIGRKGEYIKKMVEETRARIKVLDGPPGSQQRAVLISAKEVPDAPLPPAMDGLLRIHKRIVDGLETDPSQDQPQAPPSGGKVSTRLLVPATQAGSLIGKQGATVKSIQESASCIVRVLGQDDLPVFALQDDRVVEVVGEAVNVHKAVELIAQHLRKFVVDRGIISVFEKQMQAPAAPMGHMPPQPWGPPHHPISGGGGLGGYNMQYMPPPQPQRQNNYYPPASMAPPPDRQAHQGISAYGREPPIGANVSSNTQAASSMITQMTQHMQVPLIYADNVIGANGATISYIRRASGTTVTVQETRGAPGEMTVEISGTASQVQTAQQLIQNYMAEAAAAAAANTATGATQTGGATDQTGYNSYAAAPAPVYGTTPSSAGHPTQPGAYGSVYGASYGY